MSLVIKLPFKAHFRDLMQAGQKTATTRTKRFGNIGDTFQAFGVLFRLTQVEAKTLADISENYFKQEGFESPEHFQLEWSKIHPCKRFISDEVVILHLFEMKTFIKPRLPGI